MRDKLGEVRTLTRLLMYEHAPAKRGLCIETQTDNGTKMRCMEDAKTRRLSSILRDVSRPWHVTSTAAKMIFCNSLYAPLQGVSIPQQTEKRGRDPRDKKYFSVRLLRRCMCFFVRLFAQPS